MPRTSVKSPDAFRTISEAADTLDLPQHVLRFWETRFSQIKPMKRSGGRRYYRPTDIALLQGIRHLLYDEGYTIKGVQRILREQGVAHVSGLNGSGATEAQTGKMAAYTAAQETVQERPANEPVATFAQPTAPPASVAQPPPQTVDTAQQAMIRTPPPPPPQPAVSAPAQTAFVPSTSVPQAAVQPQVAQPAPPPPPPPVISEPTPLSPETVTRPPLGPFSTAQSSTLRFVPEAEAPLDTALPIPITPTLQPASPPAPAPAPLPVVTPPAETSALPPVVNEPYSLSSKDTETLARALRTLLDCKAILDSARQPALKSETTGT